MREKIRRIVTFFTVAIFFITSMPVINVDAAPTIAGSGRLLIGYWHNFKNNAGIIKLSEINPAWDVINISFAETYGDTAVVELHPCYDEEEFIQDIKDLQAKGKKVVLSLGGAEGKIHVPTDAAREKLWNSMTGLIDKYGFDGIDIDLESGSNMYLNPGDTDLDNPVTPQLCNFIKIIKDLVKKYGDEFIISMAPEVCYVQGGITNYATNWGGYLPVINAVRDELDFLQVQHYNCGGNEALDHNTYNEGTADFQVAMVDMLLQGFETKASKNSFFKPLREDQVVIGVPAQPNATLNPNAGYTKPAEMLKALNYIVYGKSFGGAYKMVGEKYPNLRGMMTWSINWDVVNGEEFVKSYRPFLDSLPPIVPDEITLRSATIKSSKVEDQSYTLTVEVPSYNSAVSYELFENDKSIDEGNLKSESLNNQIIKKEFSKKAYGVYNYKVVVKDSIGNSLTSRECVVKVNDPNEDPYKEDINKDNKIDIDDLSSVALKYNLKATDSGFDVKYDMNGDSIIDIFDLVMVGKRFGEEINVEPTNGWKTNTSYKVGDIVSYDGKSYKCIYAHTSNDSWLPGTVPTLWEQI